MLRDTFGRGFGTSRTPMTKPEAERDQMGLPVLPAEPKPMEHGFSGKVMVDETPKAAWRKDLVEGYAELTIDPRIARTLELVSTTRWREKK